MGNLTVTVNGVPDGARLSAGQFLGDGVWSVPAGDLDGLALHPSPGRNRSCRLSIRLRKIDKDMGDAFSIGAVYIDVDGDAGRATIAGSDGAISLRRKGEAGDARPAEKPARRVVKVARVKRAPPAAPPTVTAPTAPPAVRDGMAPKPVSASPPAPPPTPTPDPPDRADETGIVAVRVAPGLRIGKFGKTGRPEQVVSVRGRSAEASAARPDGGGSIVFVRRRVGARSA